MKNDFFHNFLTDLKVELMDEFDKNFERKGFFDEPWDPAKFPNRRGSLMMRTGALRRSIRGMVKGNGIQFFSSLPYASIHNEGGTITVTAKMQRFFWAMYYKSSGSVTKTATGGVRNTARNRAMESDAAFWKGMALKPVGDKIKIKRRRFIGAHENVDRIVNDVLNKKHARIRELYQQKI